MTRTFSLWSLLRNDKSNNIKNIYITASGGPFLNLPKKNFQRLQQTSFKTSYMENGKNNNELSYIDE